MAEITTHYYLECPKYLIYCEDCEFKFTRIEYVKHDCIRHYKVRQIELVFFIVTYLFLMYNFDTTSKLVFERDCTIIGWSKDLLL